MDKRMSLWPVRMRLGRRSDRPQVFMDKHYAHPEQRFHSLRNFVEFLDQRHTNVSIFGLLTHTTMEVVSVAFYVWTSQVTAATSVTEFAWGLPVFIVELVLSIIFFLAWVGLFFFEPDKKAYLISWLSLVNAMTSIPMIVIGIGALKDSSWRSVWVPMYLRVWWLCDCLSVLIDYPQIARHTPEMWREMVRYFIRLFAVMCTCVGTHQIVESCSGVYVDLYDSLYLIIVAFATIGFGDVTAFTTPARIFMIAFIVIGICFFLPLFQRLSVIAERSQLHNTFSGGGSASWLRRGWKHPHVIICGQFSDLSVELLLRNFYAGWRKYLDTCIVLMAPEEHSPEVRLAANLPWLKGRVTLMVGDPAKPKDLDRAKARDADAIFLFGDSRSTAYYQDYTIIAQSVAVSLYDRNLPQHLLLHRNCTVKQISPYAASVLEVERILHHLLGLSMAHPGVVPLIVNLLRTYESLPSDITLSRHWVEQYEYSLRNDMYGLEIPDALRGREFRVLARSFFEKDVTLIGILNARSVVQLNPRELVPNAKKLILIAKTMKVAQDATDAIARDHEQTFGEEMLAAPDPDEHDRAKRRRARSRFLVHLRSSSSSSSSGVDGDVEDRNGAPKQRGDRWPRQTAHVSASRPATPTATTTDSQRTQPVRPHAAAAALENGNGLARAFPSVVSLHPSGSSIAAEGSSGDEFDARSSIVAASPSPPSSMRAPPVRSEALVRIDDAFDLENHFVVVDLSSAKAKDESSRYAQEAVNTAVAHDIFHVTMPVRQAYPANDIVLLTNDVSFGPYLDYYWSVHRQDSANPVKYISGCGLNTADLRRCNLERCAGCCVFYAGDVSRSGSTSAMSMLTVLSINEILHGIPAFPVVVELEGLANLPLFPPHAEDLRLRTKAEIDFVYEPNFIIGNAVSRLMLFPALQRTYFMEEFIDVMDVLISGHAPDTPALARLPLSLFQAELQTYEDVVVYCLKFGYLPIALQRRIVDVRNPSINGQRFVLTNPPRALPVNQQTDLLFYITPG
ncbi:putative calcium/potassium channel (CAKC) [Leishmania major strain Friedlin]|uniref:Putative calcium/potassium channel (CAKC) n=1 Tax=Leishmania major TaxID=5664 RepID=E9AC72_LEIMA|nr:putative calcium/potassium channel (CAKC) [Leishmania major strain Friedlin]CAG9567147.1 calcium/potassium_channel_(CAKC)_-_putative [Leishmania major strain Friedlin]CBZ11886.1 putative calcium/potassium channel (CAKC) [Leishmania major strain Friedlin]|eukprot:XP_003721603.1 putative calcium/potassium channel (CAKC) [Leishmania major strain Friedlin]